MPFPLSPVLLAVACRRPLLGSALNGAQTQHSPQLRSGSSSRSNGLLAETVNSLTSKLPVLAIKKQIASPVTVLRGVMQDKPVIFALIHL